jgi:hypothetical protein
MFLLPDNKQRAYKPTERLRAPGSDSHRATRLAWLAWLVR